MRHEAMFAPYYRAAALHGISSALDAMPLHVVRWSLTDPDDGETPQLDTDDDMRAVAIARGMV